MFAIEQSDIISHDSSFKCTTTPVKQKWRQKAKHLSQVLRKVVVVHIFLNKYRRLKYMSFL